MSTWYYAQNNKPCGPVDTGALQELLRNRGGGPILPPDTLVWKDNMANWTPANAIPEFAIVISAAPNTPPPLPSLLGIPPSGGSGTPPLSDFAPPPRNAPPPMSPSPASAGDPIRADVDQNKVYAILSYIGILFLVPLLAAPESPFARYHTNQGIVLFISALVVHFASIFIGFATLGLGFLGVPLGWMVILVFMILGIVNAANGQCKPLPLIGHFQLMK
jgi:uncharacterized membrane protein